MPRIGIFYAPSNSRSKLVAQAMAKGLQRLSIPFVFCSSHSVRPTDQYDQMFFYGWAQGLRQIFDRQIRRKKAFYIDLGYWGRRKRTRWDGYHKIVMNDRHPTAYFQNRQHDPARFEQFGLEIAPWRKSGTHILLAGMSAKAAAAEGFRPNEWERRTIAQLRQTTDRPIVYRPKPNWRDARPLEGSTFGQDQTLEEALRDCHAVVAHHSNVAVDALMAGVPCVCLEGVASVLSARKLAQIESPPTPEGRAQWAADLAWTQYSMEEMEQGLAYRYLQDEGLA